MTTFELNNGTAVEFVGLDAWSRPIMQYMKDGSMHRCVIVDNRMYAADSGEPDYPLPDSLQLKAYDFDFMKGEFVKKAEVSL